MNSLNIKKVLANRNLTQALIGINIDEFKSLGKAFDNIWRDYLISKSRKRAVGGGRKGVFPDSTSKLFYILFYVHVHPTMDVASKIFGIDRSRCCRMIQMLLPLLTKLLDKNIVLPNYQMRDIYDFYTAFPEAKKIICSRLKKKSQAKDNKKPILAVRTIQ